jgi:hypothetical protein
MKLVIAVCVMFALGVCAAPAGASSVPQSLDAALQLKVESVLNQDYSMSLEDGEYECNRKSFRLYECDLSFSATMTQDMSFTDMYGDDVTAAEGDTVNCDTTATVHRKSWGKLTLKSAGVLQGTPKNKPSQYSIAIDEPSCELANW